MSESIKKNKDMDAWEKYADSSPKEAKTKALKNKKAKKEKIYIAPPAPETAFHKRNAEEQKQHEEYYKKNKGHYEYR